MAATKQVKLVEYISSEKYLKLIKLLHNTAQNNPINIFVINKNESTIFP